MQQYYTFDQLVEQLPEICKEQRRFLQLTQADVVERLENEDFIAYGGWNHTCSDHKLTEQTETIMAYFPGAIRKDWIVDQKAHDEQVVIGYQCSCGDIHKVENN